MTDEKIPLCPECGHRLHPDEEVQQQEVGACACSCHPWNKLPAFQPETKVRK